MNTKSYDSQSRKNQQTDSSSAACKKLFDDFYVTGRSHSTHISKMESCAAAADSLLADFAHAGEVTVNRYKY